MKKKDEFLGSKIEINETNGEPSIVEVPIEETVPNTTTEDKPKKKGLKHDSYNQSGSRCCKSY